jgi:ComF family protein
MTKTRQLVLQRAGFGLIDWVFPATCAGCQALIARGDALCAVCRLSLVPIGPCCPRCAEPTGQVAVVCKRCVIAPLAVDEILVPWRYGGQLAQALKRLKFAQGVDVARSIAPLWSGVLHAAAINYRADMLVNVPLHWRRRIRRGYDQTSLLLRHAARGLHSTPIVDALLRQHSTNEQARLSAAGRRLNMRGAFAVARRHLPQVQGATVIIFDDVVTTGATMSAAAKALKQAGAARVIGICIARDE